MERNSISVSSEEDMELVLVVIAEKENLLLRLNDFKKSKKNLKRKTPE